MRIYNVERQLSILEEFNYKIYDEDNSIVYTASKVPEQKTIDKLMTELIGLSLAVTLKDPDNKALVTVKKNPPTPFSSNNFRIITNNYRYSVKDGNNFTVPDLVFSVGKRQFNVAGEIRAQQFYISEEDDVLVKISGKFVENAKSYSVEIIREFENCEAISLSIAIILDILYPDY